MELNYETLITISTALDHYATYLENQLDKAESAWDYNPTDIEELDDALWHVEYVIDEIEEHIYQTQLTLGLLDDTVLDEEDYNFVMDLWDDIEMYEEIEEDEYSVIA